MRHSARSRRSSAFDGEDINDLAPQRTRGSSWAGANKYAHKSAANSPSTSSAWLDPRAPRYVLPLLILDECGPRVSELGDGRRRRPRRGAGGRSAFAPTLEKNERYRFLYLPDDLFAALRATLPPHQDRDAEAPLFPDVTDANLRMAIARACRASGTPHFSPHSLRRRRGSLHYKRTGSLAEVAELLGDSKRVAADHYVYALVD